MSACDCCICCCAPKLVVAEQLGSGARRADAMDSATCGWLSLVVLVGLIVQALPGL